MENRFNSIEVCLAEQGRMLDDLSAEVIRLNKIIISLEKKLERIQAEHSENFVKPLSEETPPPHY